MPLGFVTLERLQEPLELVRQRILSVAGALDHVAHRAREIEARGHPQREEVGDVVNTFGPHAEKCQLAVFVVGQSRWVVDKTSYLNDLTLAAGAAVAAPEGATLALTVNGVVTPLKAGAYHGAIVLQVARR